MKVYFERFISKGCIPLGEGTIDQKIIDLLGDILIKMEEFELKFKTIDQNQTQFQQTLNTLVLRVDGFDQEQKNMRSEMAEMRSEMAGIRTEINDMKKSLIRIETQHGQKLNALFDMYSLLHDNYEKTSLDIEKINWRLNKQDFALYFHGVELAKG